jgi:hypothetical protein
MLGANEKTQATPTYFERIFFKNNSLNFFKFFLINFYIYYYVKIYLKHFKKYVISKVLKPIYKSFLCFKIIVTMFNEGF